MINKIGLQNIRVFKEKQEFNLSPFTILTGTNNSGKSALQKILILLSTGLKKLEGNFVDLDTIYFEKEFVELTGDYASNVSYNSESDQMHFFFGFEDELFGEVEAELIYARGKNSLSASIRNLIISKDDATVVTFERFNLKEQLANNNPNDVLFSGEDYAWVISDDSIESSGRFFRQLLLEKKNLGNKQERLLELDNKIQKGKELSPSELMLKAEFEVKNIEFNSKHVRDNNHEFAPLKVDWYLWDKEKDQELFFCEKSQEISEIFISPYPEVLVNTELTDLVLGETDLLSSNTDEKYKSIKTALGDVNIFTKEDFIEEYTKFEIYFLIYCWSSVWSGVGNAMTEYDDSIVYAEEFIKYFCKVTDYKEAPINEPFLENKILQNSVISKILVNNNLAYLNVNNKVDIQDLFRSFSKSNKKSKKKENEKKDKGEFFDRIMYIQNSLFQLPRKLSSDLYRLNDKFLFSLHNSTIKRHFFVADTSNTDSPFLEFGYRYINNEDGVDRSKGFIDKWIKEFGIGDSFEIKPITLNDEIVGVSYYLVENGKLYPIGDCGRGINQLLFIILRVVSLEPKSLIMLEEPETNMHPALQSRLADMFFESHKRFETKFIVETHSEYLIRRFQYLVAKSSSIRRLIPRDISIDLEENNISKLQNLLNTKESKSFRLRKLAEKQLIKEKDISIYYLYNPRQVPINKKQIESLAINSDGSLEGEFGTGFFDEATNWKVELMRIKHAQKN